VDECISEFEDAVQRHAGEWWAPTSEFPCSKDELVDELIERRYAAQYGDETYMRLTGLLIDSTRFVPEEDLDLAAPYMTTGGGISGRPCSDTAEEAARMRSYETFDAHRAAGKLLFHRLRLDPPYRQPIGNPVWTPTARFSRGFEATVGGATHPGTGAHWYLLAALMVLPARLWAWIKGVRHS